MVVDVHWSYACRRACEDEVASLQREETAHVAHYLIHRVNHVGRMTALHRSAVDVEVETEVLDVLAQTFLRHEAPYGCRAVEAFAYLPGQPFCPQPFLHITCREVDTHGHGVVVAMSEALRY